MWRAARMNKLIHSHWSDTRPNDEEAIDSWRISGRAKRDDLRNKEIFLSLFFLLSRSIILVYSTTWLSTTAKDQREEEDEEEAAAATASEWVSEEAREASFCHTYLISRDGNAQKTERKRDARLR